jgi:hypothetical protein
MKSFQIVAENLDKFYQLTGLKSARMCALAKDNGISLSTSTLSRFLNGANTSIETLDSLVSTMRLVPGYEAVTQALLLTPSVFDEKDSHTPAVLSVETLKSHYAKLLIDLHDIGWVKLNQKPGMDTITDFCIHTFKKTGFDLAEGKTGPALRSGT